MASTPTSRAVPPVRLSMLNLDEKIGEPRQRAALSSNAPQQIAALMQHYRGETALRVHVHDDNNRLNERDPSVCLNYLLLKEWCMFNALEMYDSEAVLH